VHICGFRRRSFIIAVSALDILLAGKEDKQMMEVKQALSKRFQVKDMGELHDFLGVKVVQDQHTREVWIGQPALTKNILQKFGMESCNAISTAVDSSARLIQAEEHDEFFDQALYKSAISSLLYLSIRKQPDIAYAMLPSLVLSQQINFGNQHNVLYDI